MKRFSSLVLCIVLALSLTGCEKVASVSDTSSTEPSTNVVSSVSSQEPANPDEGEKIDASVVTDYALSIMFDSILCVNGLGDIVDVVPFSKLDGEVICVADGYAFVREYDFYAPLEERYILKALDLKNGLLGQIYKGKTLNTVDVYNGLIYINSDGLNMEKDDKVVLDAKTFKEVEGATVDLKPVQDGYIELPRMLSFSNRCSEERMIDTAGFVVVLRDGQLLTYDGSALTQLVNIPSGYKSVDYYDKEFLIYENTDNETNSSELHCYSFSEKRDVYVRKNYGTYNTYKDGKIYFATTEGSIGTYSGSILYFDVYANLEKRLCEFTKEPGMDTYALGSEGFMAANGKCFFVGEDKDSVGWYMVDADGAHKTDYVLNVSTFGKYGKVDCTKSVVKCRYCGEIIYEFYEEYLALDSSFGPHVDEINAAMKEKALARMEDGEAYADTYSYDASECSDRGHGQYYGCETSESRIVRINTFSEGKYLYVEKSGYWYGGGAHGYPLTASEFYDLSTGKEVTLMDVFPGTEEDLKNLIADKTVELYEYYVAQDDGYNPFDFEESSEDVRAVAMESINPPYDVWFTEDGIIYYYPPYVMASYAQGYVEVPISFEELGLSDIIY